MCVVLLLLWLVVRGSRLGVLHVHPHSHAQPPLLHTHSQANGLGKVLVNLGRATTDGWVVAPWMGTGICVVR